MKYSVVSAAVLAAALFAASPATAKMMSCSSADMSKMVTMIGGMPDGAHKSEMNKHLAMANAAMAKGDMPKCNMMMKGSKMSMMKSGM